MTKPEEPQLSFYVETIQNIHLSDGTEKLATVKVDSSTVAMPEDYIDQSRQQLLVDTAIYRQDENLRSVRSRALTVAGGLLGSSAIASAILASEAFESSSPWAKAGWAAGAFVFSVTGLGGGLMLRDTLRNDTGEIVPLVKRLDGLRELQSTLEPVTVTDPS